MKMPQQRYVDLHLHTDYSDGTETVEVVLRRAHEAGMAAVSVSDHDTVAGLNEARGLAAGLGMEFINGIELSSEEGGHEVHILGYGFDADSAPLAAFLEERRAQRADRIRRCVRQLEGLGLKLDADAVLASAGRGTAGRPHIARLMVKKGYVGSFREAFDCYLGSGKPGYVPGSAVSPKDAIGRIRAAGGVAVLAHPMFLQDEGAIERLAGEGLQGLEAYHSAHNAQLRRHYEERAGRLGLLVTGGSDYHGADHQEGGGIGCAAVPYVCYERLAQRAGECA